MDTYRIAAAAGVLAVLAGLGKGALDGWTLSNDLRLRDEGVIVPATVVSKRQGGGSRHAWTSLMLRYTDRNGTSRNNEAYVVTTSGLNEGADIQVRYDPDHPDVVLPVDEEIRTQPHVVGLVGAGMLVIGGIISFIVSTVLRRRKERSISLM